MFVCLGLAMERCKIMKGMNQAKRGVRVYRRISDGLAILGIV